MISVLDLILRLLLFFSSFLFGADASKRREEKGTEPLPKSRPMLRRNDPLERERGKENLAIGRQGPGQGIVPRATTVRICDSSFKRGWR